MAGRTDTEQARQAEQDALDRQSAPGDRNRLGQYATPPELAAEIAEVARAFWPTGQPVRFLEPCIGTGAFYSAVLSRFPSGRVVRAVGYELDPRSRRRPVASGVRPGCLWLRGISRPPPRLSPSTCC